jgi:hypothetical protein
MPRSSSLKPQASSLLIALAIASISGCGGSTDPFSYVKENGKVTFEDGSLIPAARIQVIFRSETPPVDPKYNPPLGIGEVNVADGTYSVMSHVNEGLVPGKHKVIVRCTDAKEKPLLTLIAPEYGDMNKTPLEADTNNPASFNFALKKYTGPPGGPNAPGMQGHGRPGVQTGQR